MSKMGISTVASYTGAQVFEAIGLSARARRRVLHRHRLAPGRHRPGRDRRRDRAPPSGGVSPSGPTSARIATWTWAASISGGAKASITSSIRRRCSSCSTPRAPSATTCTRSTPNWSTISRADWRRCADCSRSRTASREPVPIDEVEPVSDDRQALRDRRDVVRLDLQGSARDAGDRHESDRRQVQHRRGWRGRGSLRARRERRSAPLGDQAGGLWSVRRHVGVPGQRRRSCRSRWRRAPSPARAANCPATRCIRGSRGRATPRRASA